MKKFKNVLSREEMKSVNGGKVEAGTCGWSGGGISGPVCGVSKSDATALQANFGGNWCCDSCASTSYCGAS